MLEAHAVDGWRQAGRLEDIRAEAARNRLIAGMAFRTKHLRDDEEHVRLAAIGFELLRERSRARIRVQPARNVLRRDVAAAREARIDLDELVLAVFAKRLLEVHHHDVAIKVLEALDADNDDFLLAWENLGARERMRRQAGRLQRADGRRHHHLAVERAMIRDMVLARNAAEELDGLLERFHADFLVGMRLWQLLDRRDRILDEIVIFIIAEHVDDAAI